MKKRSTNELTGLIQRLTVIRKQHVASLAEIESTFRQLGIAHLLKSSAPAGRGGAKRKAAPAPSTSSKAPTGKRRGRPPKAATAAKATKAAGRAGKKAGKRVRGKFEVTGDELILEFVRKLGCPTTEEIRRHWESEGRRGKAENNLTNLVKGGKLVRNRLAGQTRSTYSLPSSAS